MDKGISHVLSMSILLYGLRRPIFNSQDKEPYSFVELKAQEKTGLLLMPTAKVTKNVSAAEGGGNVLCSILISIKTKAWLYSFGCTIYKISSNRQMMKTDLNYCIVLSSEQLAYLAGSKYGIDRMKILHRLIEEAVLKETDYAIKGFSTTLQVGQAVLSEVDLANKLGYDKKTISRVLDKMNQLGIVVSTQSNRTSIHTLKCISAWMQDGNRIDNPFYVRLKDRQNDKEDMPAISDEGKQPSPSSFPSGSPQTAATEDSGGDIPADNQI